MEDKMSEELDLKGIVESIFSLIPSIARYHDPSGQLYIVLDKILRGYFRNHKQEVMDVSPFKGVIWPQINLVISPARIILYCMSYCRIVFIGLTGMSTEQPLISAQIWGWILLC